MECFSRELQHWKNETTWLCVLHWASAGPFLQRILEISSRGRKELLEGGSYFFSSLLNFIRIFEAGFCMIKPLCTGQTLLQPSGQRFSQCFGCKPEEAGLCYLGCFQHGAESEERAAMSPLLVQKMQLIKKKKKKKALIFFLPLGCHWALRVPQSMKDLKSLFKVFLFSLQRYRFICYCSSHPLLAGKS